jgi:type II secretory pathway component GspD/PulD (secretin)
MLRYLLVALCPFVCACATGVVDVSTPVPAADGRQMQVVVLQHTAAAEIAPLLSELLNDSGGFRDGPEPAELPRTQWPPSYVHVTATTDNRVIVDGTSAIIAKALDVIARLDVPTPAAIYRRQTEIVALQHRPAEEIAPVVRDLVADRHAVRSGYQTGPVRVPRFPDLSVTAGSANRLVLEGTRERVEEALELIARLDVPIEASLKR